MTERRAFWRLSGIPLAVIALCAALLPPVLVPDTALAQVSPLRPESLTLTRGNDLVHLAATGLGATDSVTVTTTAPAKPTGLRTVVGDKSVALHWTPGEGGGTPTGYEYRRKTTDTNYTGWDEAGTGTSTRVTGLVNDTSYTFQVRATNSIGQSDASDAAAGTPKAAQAKMYWTNTLTDTIHRANLDGTSTEAVITGLNTPMGVAVDAARGKIYWTDGSPARSACDGTIHRANLDGTAMEDLITGLGCPRGMAADFAGGKIYWADIGTDKVQRANLDGTSVADLFRIHEHSIFAGVALDVASGDIYVADELANKVKRGKMNGSGSLADLITISEEWAQPSSVALDVAAGKVYVGMQSGYNNIRILRADMSDGSNTETLVSKSGFKTHGLALDVADNKMYWFRHDGDDVAEIVRAPRSMGPTCGEASTSCESLVTSTDWGTKYIALLLKPEKPRGFTAAPGGDTEVRLDWAAPSGASVEKYEIQRKTGTGNFGNWTEITDSGPGTTSHTVTGLTNGTAYSWKIRAVNSIGTSPESDEAGTTAGPPAKPEGLTTTVYSESVVLAWADPSDSTITKYQVCRKTDSSACASGQWQDINGSGASTTRHTVTGLTNGTAYRFRLRAVNSWGNGAQSSQVSATPVLYRPAAPTGLSATPQNEQVVLSWTRPSGTITEYRYSQDDGATWKWIIGSGASTTSHTVTGLTNATTYTFRVRAENWSVSQRKEFIGAPSNAAPATPTAPAASPPPPAPSPPSPTPPAPSPTPPAPSPTPPAPSPTPPAPSPTPPAPSPTPPAPSPPPAPDDGTSAEDDEEEQEPEPAVEVRITARLVSGQRIEFALQQRTDGSWGSPRRPSQRYFPLTTAVGRWLRSTTLNIDGQRLRIVARRLADGRVEFGMQHRRGDAWSERILPTRRFFPTGARLNRWLSSTPMWAYPHQPRPSACNRTSQVAEALAEAADKPCAEVNGADLAAIERLDLSDAGLSALRSTDLAGLGNLTSLDLSENQFRAVNSEALAYTPRLATLNLASNRLSELAPGVLEQVSSLTTLNLADNRITRFRAGALRGAGQLTNLNLDSNRLTSISSRTLNDAPNLQEISLANNRIQRLSNNTFRQLENLQALTLRGNPGAPFNNLNTPENTRIIQ